MVLTKHQLLARKVGRIGVSEAPVVVLPRMAKICTDVTNHVASVVTVSRSRAKAVARIYTTCEGWAPIVMLAP
jgi:hypothetical protein